MEYSTYMNAYSVDTWIRKILTGEIELPPYQRDFEWELEQGQALLDSMEKGIFIPPVILGEYKGKTYLLDGQQRLTSLICLYAGVWPIDENKDKPVADNIELSNDDIEYTKFFSPFTFRYFQTPEHQIELMEAYNKGETPFCEVILKKYGKLLEKKFPPKGDFDLRTPFIPLCHIFPTENNNGIEKFYADTFRKINTGGKALTGMELRRALYWLHEPVKEKLYNSEIENWDKDPRIGKATSLDFVSYLAIICDYYSGKSNTMAGCHRGNKKWKGTKRFEDYVTDFISALVAPDEAKRWSNKYLEKITPEKFTIFKSVFDCIEKIKGSKQLASDKKAPLFENQTEADFYMFGLVSYVYFDDAFINWTENLEQKITSLIEKIDVKRKKNEEDANYKRDPNALLRIRIRLNESYNIWKEEFGEVQCEE